MNIKKGDTVRILNAFGYDPKTDKPIHPDIEQVGKYARVTGKEGIYINIKLIDGGAKYGALPNHLEKITFTLTDHRGQTIITTDDYTVANMVMDKLIFSDAEGYWRLVDSDGEPWQEGGLDELANK